MTPDGDSSVVVIIPPTLPATKSAATAHAVHTVVQSVGSARKTRAYGRTSECYRGTRVRVTYPRTDRVKCATASAGAACNLPTLRGVHTPWSSSSIVIACPARTPQAAIGERRTTLTIPVPVVLVETASVCVDSEQPSVNSDQRDDGATPMQGALQGRVSVDHEVWQACERRIRCVHGGREGCTREIQAGRLSKSAQAAVSTGPARPFSAPCRKLSLIAWHSRTAWS